jgi:cytochrome c-type biogenesis protein
MTIAGFLFLYLSHSIFCVPGQGMAAAVSATNLARTSYFKWKKGSTALLTRRQILIALGIFLALTIIDLPTALGRCPGEIPGKPVNVTSSDPLGIAIFGFGLLGGLFTFLSPCGLPMFPAFTSYYLGSKPNLLRSLSGGLTAAAGMIAAFSILTISTYSLGSTLSGYAEILELAGGLIALMMGVLMMVEFRLLRFPSGLRAPVTHGSLGLFFFGSLWGFAEIICTPFLFISVLVFAITNGLKGTTSFIGFGVGMIVPVIMLTLLTVKGRRSVVEKILPHLATLHRLSSLILFFLGVILVSLSLLYYGVI